MKSLSPRAKAALADYRSEHALPVDVRARARQALGARIAAGQPGSPAPYDAPPPVLPSAGHGRLLRFGVVAGVGSLALLGGLLLGSAWTRPAKQPPAAAHAFMRPAPSAPRQQVADSSSPLRSEPNAAPSSSALATARATPRPKRVAQARPIEAQTTITQRADHTQHEPQVTPVARAPLTAPDLAVQDGTPSRSVPAARPAGAGTSDASFSSATVKIQNARPKPSLDAEVTLLQTAHEQLRAEQPARALDTLREHAERYPRGELHEMRKVTRIMALCALHKLDTARHEAEQFLEDYASSRYAPRVRQLCDAKTPSPRLP